MMKLFARSKLWSIYLDSDNSINKAPLFDIYLSNSRLSFSDPNASYERGDVYFKLNFCDERPFVNVKSQSSYSFFNDMNYGYKSVYFTAWEVFNKKKDPEPVFRISLSLSLITPLDGDQARFGNLFVTENLINWLQKHLRHQIAMVNSVSIQTLAQGANSQSLVIDTGDDEALHDNIVSDDAPIEFVKISISGLPALVTQFDHQKIQFYIPVSCRDVLVFSFNLTSIDNLSELISQGMLLSVKPFIEAVMKTVEIDMSEKDIVWNKIPQKLLSN